MIRLCVFDMDGLLLDSERVLYIKNGMEVSKILGRPLSKEFLCSLMGNSWDIYPKKVLEAHGEDYPIDEYLRLYWERIDKIIFHEAIPVMPGVIEMLDFLKEEGIPMAVATSTIYEKTMACLKNAGIADYFDYVIAGDMVEHGKPEPDIFLKAIEHFGVEVKDALVFEDGHNGAQAAIKGGCPLIIVQDLAQLTQEEFDKSIMVIDNIAKAIPYIKEQNETTTGIQA